MTVGLVILSPAVRIPDSFFPAFDALFPVRLINGGSKSPVDCPVPDYIFLVFPVTRGQSGRYAAPMAVVSTQTGRLTGALMISA